MERTVFCSKASVRWKTLRIACAWLPVLGLVSAQPSQGSKGTSESRAAFVMLRKPMMRAVALPCKK